MNSEALSRFFRSNQKTFGIFLLLVLIAGFTGIFQGSFLAQHFDDPLDGFEWSLFGFAQTGGDFLSCISQFHSFSIYLLYCLILCYMTKTLFYRHCFFTLHFYLRILPNASKYHAT